MLKLYTASSWRNKNYPDIVAKLKRAGFEVYDFQQAISTTGKDVAFNWDQIDPKWEIWSNREFVEALRNPLAENAFKSDREAMERADACILILPCGKSAHIEAGYMKGLGKKLYILLDSSRPELTYSISDGIFDSITDLIVKLWGVQ